MSQTRKTLKSLASGELYQTLVTAIEKADYGAILSSYTEISKLVEEAEKEITQKIQSLPRRNRDDDCQKFRSSFRLRSRTTLPKWHWLNAEFEKQKIMEGVVFGFGSKGDPLVRTLEGRIVVLSGAKLKEGDKTRFKVFTEGQKLDFGRVFELTPDSFYFILTQDTRQKIKDSLTSIKERIGAHSEGTCSDGFAEISGLLRELEDVRELASQLQTEEKERIVSQVQAYRRRLLETSVVRMVFDFISGEEKREISEFCRSEFSSGVPAPGLFHREAHETLKAKFFAGQDPQVYSETVKKLENEVNSMSSAVQLLDFKAGMDRVYPSAKRYIDKMDRLFERLSEKAREFALKLAEDKVHDAGQVNSVITKDFSGHNLCSELRRVFRSADEFFALREALMELISKLGDVESLQAEAAIRPYLRQKISFAFGKTAELPA